MIHSVNIGSNKPVESSLRRWLGKTGATFPCYIQLGGILGSVDVCAAPDSPPVSLTGPLYIVTAQTTFETDSVTTMGVVSWSDNGVPRLLAGRLTNLAAEQVNAILLLDGGDLSPLTLPPEDRSTLPAIHDDLGSLPPDDSKGPPAYPPPIEATTEMPKIQQVKQTLDVGWGEAIQESRKHNTATRPDSTDELKPGDVLLHPKFGRCRVAREPMFGKVKVRRPSGALIDLHMKILEFSRGPDEDGRRVFKISISRKSIP